MRHLFLSLLVCLGVAACGGGDPADVPSNQGGGGAGNPGGGAPGGGGGAGGGGGPVSATIFNETAIDLGVAGAFPSDLVSDGNGTLFTVDDATIPATVVGYSERGLGAPTMSVAITAAHLIDHDRIAAPARAPATFGSGLFGAFTGDLEVAFGRWLFVTVSAGNSVSNDGTGPLRLANLLVIDTQSGTVVQTVNLAWALEGNVALSDGASFSFIPQSLPSMVAFVPNDNGTPTGTVYVAMSNGAGSTAGLSVFFPGTVQAWSVDFGKAQPLGIKTAGKAPTDVTRTFVSAGYNPVGLTSVATARGFRALILTAAGASMFDANFVAQPTTDAALEFLDLDGDVWRDNWAINLGPILPSTHALAIGADARGRRFGLLTSQTFAAVYVVDLDGLEENPVDPSRLGLLRSASLVPGGATTAGSGFQPGLALSLTGRSAVVASFDTSMLHVVGLPDDIGIGAIEVNPAPYDVSDRGPALGSGLGRVLLSNDPGAPFFFIVNGGFDANFNPNRNGFVGTLTVPDGLP